MKTSMDFNSTPLERYPVTQSRMINKSLDLSGGSAKFQNKNHTQQYNSPRNEKQLPDLLEINKQQINFNVSIDPDIIEMKRKSNDNKIESQISGLNSTQSQTFGSIVGKEQRKKTKNMSSQDYGRVHDGSAISNL